MRLRVVLTLFAALTFAPAAFCADQLRYAVIFSRHGVRSPTWTPERLNAYSSAPWPDFGVPPGDLTKHGRELMKLMGDYYREWLTAGGLLQSTPCSNTSRVYIHADNDQRTIETARALSEGLLPGCGAETHSIPEGKQDPLFDPISAGNVKPDAAIAVASVTGRIGPNLNAIVEDQRTEFDLLNRVLTGGAKTKSSLFDQPVAIAKSSEGAAMSGPLNTASTLTEVFQLEYANGFSGNDFAWGRLSTSDLLQVLALHSAYADLMRRSPYIAKERGSNLLSHIVNSMEQAVKGSAVPGSFGAPGNRLLLISGHDTNISNLSGMLNLSWTLPGFAKDDTPAGGALVFSLWQSDSKVWSVRLQYLAQSLEEMHAGTVLSLKTPPLAANVFIPGCGTAAEGYACAWTDFVRVARSVIDPAAIVK